MSQSVDEFMDGAGVTSASFNGPPPITWAGEIVDTPELVQQRDFDSNEPLTWPDGRPKMMLMVVIQTDARDPQNPDDDGKRALYLRWRLKEAAQDAIKRAGQKGAPKKGGWLSMTYTSDDHAAKKGKNAPPKNYVAEYRAPDPWAGDQDGWGDAQPAPAQAAQAPQTPPQAGGGWGAPPLAAAAQGQAYAAPQIPQQQYGQHAPPQPVATAAPQGVPGAPAAAATGDPLVEFLTPRGIDTSSMPSRDMALNVARQLGYQGT